MLLQKLTRRVLFSLSLLAVLLTVVSATFAQEGEIKPNGEGISIEADESDSLWLTPAGGTLSFKSYPMTLQAPRDAALEPVLVTVVAVRPPTDKAIASMFRLTAQNLEGKPYNALRKAVGLEVQLDKNELLAPTKDNLVLYRYNEGLERWQALPSDMDWDEMVIRTKERHLGLFGVGVRSVEKERK